MKPIKYLKYIPIGKMVELNLTPLEMLIASTIISFHQDGVPLICSYEDLGSQFSASGRTIQRSINKLIELNLVNRKSGAAARNANQYSPTVKLKEIYNLNDIDKMSISSNNDIDKMSKNRLPKGNQYRGEVFLNENTSPRQEEKEDVYTEEEMEFLNSVHSK